MQNVLLYQNIHRIQLFLWYKFKKKLIHSRLFLYIQCVHKYTKFGSHLYVYIDKKMQ